MRKRKWWIIGLSLALLLSWVRGLTMNDSPPYRFAQGARVHWVGLEGGRMSVYYLLPQADRNIEVEARREVHRQRNPASSGSFVEPESSITGPPHANIIRASNGLLIEGNGRSGGSKRFLLQEIEPGRLPMLTFERRATLGDRLRCWLYRWTR